MLLSAWPLVAEVIVVLLALTCSSGTVAAGLAAVCGAAVRPTVECIGRCTPEVARRLVGAAGFGGGGRGGVGFTLW